MDNLPTESLIHIFSYLSLHEILSLQSVCHRFLSIIREHLELLSNSKKLLITNQVHKVMIDRSHLILRAYEKHRIQSNWINGGYNERGFLKSKVKYIPYLQLTKEHLWHSRHTIINAYDRNSLSSPKPFLNVAKQVHCGKSDVTCFKICNNLLISGQSDGTILYLSLRGDSEVTHVKQCHEDDVNCLDFDQRILVTGSKDTSLKVYLFEDDPSKEGKYLCVYEQYNQDEDRVLSTALSPNGSKLAVGTTCYTKFDFNIYDTHRMTSIPLNQSADVISTGRAIRDVLWLSDNELITGGYCAVLRLWDLRVRSTENQCVQSWADPFQGSFYCLDADRQYSILTGCDRHGRVVLWDTRQKDFVQMYFSSGCRQFSSPVYKLSFDACQLYTTTDRNLNLFDFSSGSPRTTEDYRYVKSYEVIS